MTEQQLSIFFKNRPGVMAELCEAWAAEISISWPCRSATRSTTRWCAWWWMIRPKRFTCWATAGLLVVDTDVLAVQVDNQPGTLARVARKLAAADVNIEYAYGSGSGETCALMIRVSDIAVAEAALAS